MMAVWVKLLLGGLGLGGLVAIGELLRWGGGSTTTTRRLVHGAVCVFVAGTPWVFSSPAPVCGLAALFVVVNGIGRQKGWWPGIHAARPTSWGTVAVPLAVLPAAAGTWAVGIDRVLPFQIAFLVLGIADPMAAAVGQHYGCRQVTSTSTGAGTATFVVITATLVVGSVVMAGWEPGLILAATAGTSLAAGAVEAISERGWDNLFVVLAVILVLEPLRASLLSSAELFASLMVGAVLGYGAATTGVLTRRGAVGGGLFAMALVGLGGRKWAVPGFAFFVLSSALSFLPRNTDRREGAPRRTLRQVLANGGVAWGCLMVAAVAPGSATSLQQGCYLGFLGALAAAAADTWATELGTRYGGPPWSLREGRRVASGTSGAVSFFGTGGALLGAASIALAGAVAGGTALVGASGLLCGLGAGLIGMSVDSLLGATAQARYWDPEAGALRERPDGTGEEPARGWRWIDNDAVNFLGTATGAAVALGLFWVF